MQRWLLALALLGITLSLPAALACQATARPIEQLREQYKHLEVGSLDDPRDLEIFLDQNFAPKLEEWKVPGAVFVLVKDGRVVLQKGFGLANVERKVPAHPDSTRFFIGSVSKPITALAVMRMVDQGLLRLDADVNDYLGSFRVPTPYGRPVTLAHLLTHTSGVDQRGIGIAAPRPEEVGSLEGHLARRFPPPVAPPGTRYLYSNYGYALAAHLVERRAGIPFEAYMQRDIFAPLGMTQSGYDTVYDDSSIAPSYQLRGGDFERTPRLYFHIRPALGLVSSAGDMGRFMIAMLDAKRGGQRIIGPETVDLMMTRQWGPDSNLLGMTYGFNDRPELGLQVLGHGGLINWHTAALQLLPEHRAGFFVACNSVQCAGLESMIERLLVRYFAGRRPDVAPLSAGRLEGSEIAGSYRPDRHARRTFEKLREQFDNFRLDVVGETLTVGAAGQFRKSVRWVPTGEGVFRPLEGDGYMRLSQNDGGRMMARVRMRGVTSEPLVQLRWYETSSFHRRAASLLVLCLASPLILYPAIRLFSRRREPSARTWIRRWARPQAIAACALLLIFIAGFARVLLRDNGFALIHGVPASMIALLWLPMIAFAVAAPLPLYAVATWRHGYWNRFERLYFSALVVGIALAFAFLDYWNLLGIKY
ncbi:MAG: beta-lactamase family protein [Gemmatimonadota bacterium]|nr:beta-lactamase family protein [Gemmatimonadota bacterium]